jgi:hypothetical protein
MSHKDKYALVNIKDTDIKICHPMTFETKKRYFEICAAFALATKKIDYEKIYEILHEYENFYDSEYIVDLFEEKLSWLFKEETDTSPEIHNNISSLNTTHLNSFNKKNKNIKILYYLPSSVIMLNIFDKNKLNNLPNKIVDVTLSSTGNIYFSKYKFPIKCSIIIRNERVYCHSLKNIFKLKKNILIEVVAERKKQLLSPKTNFVSLSFKKIINGNKNIYTINKYLERKDDNGNIINYCKNNTEYFDDMDKFIYKITGGFFSIYSPNFVPCTKKYEVENVFASEKVSVIIY